MPELVTHGIVAYAVGRLAKFQSLTLIVIGGTLLPDVIVRSASIFFKGKFVWLFLPLHTPFVLVILCYVVSLLYRVGERKRIFLASTLGVIIHLVLDSLQKHYGLGYLWLFPFSWQKFEFGVFWPEESMFVIPIMIAIGGLMYLREKRSQCKRGNMA